MKCFFSDPPGKPDKPTVSDLTGESCTVQWKAPHDGGSPITHYILEKKHPKDAKWTQVHAEIPNTEFNVTGLTPDTDYVFRVTAVNKAGTGPPSDPSDVAKYGKFFGYH